MDPVRKLVDNANGTLLVVLGFLAVFTWPWPLAASIGFIIGRPDYWSAAALGILVGILWAPLMLWVLWRLVQRYEARNRRIRFMVSFLLLIAVMAAMGFGQRIQERAESTGCSFIRCVLDELDS